eukprot:347447-Pyramimonas_sp.AAC.1
MSNPLTSTSEPKRSNFPARPPLRAAHRRPFLYVGSLCSYAKYRRTKTTMKEADDWEEAKKQAGAYHSMQRSQDIYWHYYI